MTTDPFFSNATTFFLVVFRHRSFSKAAHELGVTQSAVSQTIAQLEVQIGLDLFNRTTRPLTPTKEAGVLYTELSKRQTDIKELPASFHPNRVCRVSAQNHRSPLFQDLAGSELPHNGALRYL